MMMLHLAGDAVDVVAGVAVAIHSYQKHWLQVTPIVSNPLKTKYSYPSLSFQFHRNILCTISERL